MSYSKGTISSFDSGVLKPTAENNLMFLTFEEVDLWSSLYVMKEGVHSGTGINTTWGDTGNNINHDCPTNPVIRYNVLLGNEYVCAEIRNDNSTPTTMGKITTGTYDNYNENLENTPGYRVKAFRKENNEGQQFNTVDLTTVITLFQFMLIK